MRRRYATQFVLLSEYAIGARISFVPCHSVSSVRSAVVFSARRHRRQSTTARAGVRSSPASSIVVGVVVHGVVWARREASGRARREC
uniref:Uncharacterized protein n=1 Tax=Oryza glumipatula TaxID=40148 RepID=A0A0D9YLN3_9ORYZ